MSSNTTPHLRTVYDAMGTSLKQLLEKDNAEGTTSSEQGKAKVITALVSMIDKNEELLSKLQKELKDAERIKAETVAKLQPEIDSHSKTKDELRKITDLLAKSQQSNQGEKDAHAQTKSLLATEIQARQTAEFNIERVRAEGSKGMAVVETRLNEANARLQEYKGTKQPQPMRIELPIAKPISYELDITRDMNQFIRTVTIIPKEKM